MFVYFICIPCSPIKKKSYAFYAYRFYVRVSITVFCNVMPFSLIIRYMQMFRSNLLPPSTEQQVEGRRGYL